MDGGETSWMLGEISRFSASPEPVIPIAGTLRWPKGTGEGAQICVSDAAVGNQTPLWGAQPYSRCC